MSFAARFNVLVLAILPVFSVAGCSSPGRWGYARSYAPASDEESALADSRELDAPMASTQPEAWTGAKVRFFMVVDDRRPGPGGSAYLTGKLHTLNALNGCSNKHDDGSCRVTILPQGHETVHAVVKLVGDDDVGALHVGVGSLVRIVGKLGDKTDDDDGKLVVQASWYRHWPNGYYVRAGELLQ